MSSNFAAVDQQLLTLHKGRAAPMQLKEMHITLRELVDAGIELDSDRGGAYSGATHECNS